jgi:hypothetical protein
LRHLHHLHHLHHFLPLVRIFCLFGYKILYNRLLLLIHGSHTFFLIGPSSRPPVQAVESPFAPFATYHSHNPKEPPVCESNEDCKNGGICKIDPRTIGSLNPVNHCQCVDRYWGPTCTRYCPIECYNGGICRFKSDVAGDEDLNDLATDPDHFECECPVGRQCQAPVLACVDDSMCLNGGICIVSSDNATAYMCTCAEGYTGQRRKSLEES